MLSLFKLQPAAINWNATRGIVEDAIYGGRIERALDAGCLHAYIRRYLDARLVESTDSVELAASIELPARVGSLRECAETVIEALPDVDQPAMFALPANVWRTRERAHTRRTIAQLRVLQTPIVDGKQKTADKIAPFAAWSLQLNAALSFWKRANANSTLLQQSTTRLDVDETTKRQDPLASMLAIERAFGVALASV